jgi:predicted metal-dependent phosphoesterase TrpH
MIDLHSHSTASDGTDSPAGLIAAAAAAGLHTLAITDHDSTGGWSAAVEAAARLPGPFTLIRGTEFSCVHTNQAGGRISLHLLGYLYDPLSPELRAARSALRTSRLGRGEAIVDNLAGAGYPISWQRVTEIADGGAVGRPHIGQALVEVGVVASVNEAFAELLSDDSPYYVHKQDLAVLTAIALIRGAGGVPVIAHPWARVRGAVLDEQDLAELIAGGMSGIEVDHPDHTPTDRARLRELAAEQGLLVTGSSDYHGTNKSIRIGAETTSPEMLERLIAASSGVPALSTGGR